jgi:hypothetical protein
VTRAPVPTDQESGSVRCASQHAYVPAPRGHDERHTILAAFYVFCAPALVQRLSSTAPTRKWKRHLPDSFRRAQKQYEIKSSYLEQLSLCHGDVRDGQRLVPRVVVCCWLALQPLK